MKMQGKDELPFLEPQETTAAKIIFIKKRVKNPIGYQGWEESENRRGTVPS